MFQHIFVGMFLLMGAFLKNLLKFVLFLCIPLALLIVLAPNVKEDHGSKVQGLGIVGDTKPEQALVHLKESLAYHSDNKKMDRDMVHRAMFPFFGGYMRATTFGQLLDNKSDIEIIGLQHFFSMMLDDLLMIEGVKVHSPQFGLLKDMSKEDNKEGLPIFLVISRNNRKAFKFLKPIRERFRRYIPPMLCALNIPEFQENCTETGQKKLLTRVPYQDYRPISLEWPISNQCARQS